MSRYKKLSNFSDIEGDTVRVKKNNYPILKEIIPSQEIELEEITKTKYQTSSLLKATLRPYQEQGVQWLVQHYNHGLGACLADDMGLGKTLQTIAMLVFTKEQLTPNEDEIKRIQFDLFDEPLAIKTFLKVLIILPSSLMFNWVQELQKFAPHLTIIKYLGSDRKKIAPYLETYDIVLTTYATASNDISVLEKIDFKYLILDESQQIKNKNSKVFQAISKIHASNKISLSGTPIENSLSDLWSQMQFINPGMLGSFPFFKEHFKTPIEKHQNQERIQELKELIDPFILRRTKEEVAKDLPALSEQVIYTEMLPDQEKQYESEKSIARNVLLGIDPVSINKINIINTLTKLRQLANHPQLINNTSENQSGKFKDVTNYLDILVKSKKKVLIFSSFVSHLAIYESWSKQNDIPFVCLTGQTKSDDREKVVHEFQNNDNISLFFISLKAGGVGLNLTQASYVILLDPWWNPFIEKQAIARAHRIGQAQNVIVTRFITKDTIEEKILRLQEQKKNLSNDIIEVNTVPDFVETNLESLLK
ncbi:DEAD/DEAH box helicase [Aquimarina pacifica]|uniref:DEAD/DEAH box helicase n=1 Tax=Aquimarina pacifica TaxID=1296415 RepID=UPI0004B9BD97|nr:DEAD/DEAH box helicase [Aquimarina pacifica]